MWDQGGTFDVEEQIGVVLLTALNPGDTVKEFVKTISGSAGGTYEVRYKIERMP